MSDKDLDALAEEAKRLREVAARINARIAALEAEVGEHLSPMAQVQRQQQQQPQLGVACLQCGGTLDPAHVATYTCPGCGGGFCDACVRSIKKSDRRACTKCGTPADRFVMRRPEAK